MNLIFMKKILEIIRKIHKDNLRKDFFIYINRKLICLGLNRKRAELAFFHNLYNDFGQESISTPNRKFIF